MVDLRAQFKDGEIPEDRLKNFTRDLSGLTAEWTILSDHQRSDGMATITDLFGLNAKDRQCWEFAHHLNAPRMRLELKPNAEGHPVLTVVTHDALSADCPRGIIFDGVPKEGLHLKDIVPHPPVDRMLPGFDEGVLLAAEIDGRLFVRYAMHNGVFYMTRVLLSSDPLGEEKGPVTLCKYCITTKNGAKHEAYRYHKLQSQA